MNGKSPHLRDIMSWDVKKSTFLLLTMSVILAFISGFQPIEDAKPDAAWALNNEVVTDTSKVYTNVDVMPEIEGGLPELYKHIEYPKVAQARGIEGKVFVQVIIDTKGNVKEPVVVRDIGGGCGDAAVDGIKKLKFTPGTIQGVPVKVQYTLPVTFEITD